MTDAGRRPHGIPTQEERSTRTRAASRATITSAAVCTPPGGLVCTTGAHTARCAKQVVSDYERAHRGMSGCARSGEVGDEVLGLPEDVVVLAGQHRGGGGIGVGGSVGGGVEPLRAVASDEDDDALVRGCGAGSGRRPVGSVEGEVVGERVRQCRHPEPGWCSDHLLDRGRWDKGGVLPMLTRSGR